MRCWTSVKPFWIWFNARLARPGKTRMKKSSTCASPLGTTPEMLDGSFGRADDSAHFRVSWELSSAEFLSVS